ncbi:MAG TPA: Asp-tRNA(Asn)/Glu-tRNA(Gln) amidotransferase subunit GatB, partial [Acidimicrobiaceae bacterium]|nr:Asp-tRNA(Asn)/Glu-tRNA(Gln) amidotransferase subunit GatB [Acidimicrobiaceae bacterium]
PLVEIVSRPDIRTVEHAKAYVSELRDILLAIEVSDAKMEEGSMRVDANVSVRPTGSDELRTRCELKNINSVRSLGRAIEYEARRHVDLYTSGEAPRQETRHWDEEGGRSTAGRSKEDADDYRYFQEPDLVPLAPTAAQIAEIDASMPVLPAARRARLGERSSVADEVIVTVVERGQDGLALGAIEAGA